MLFYIHSVNSYIFASKADKK